jgi:hypothetical protein
MPHPVVAADRSPLGELDLEQAEQPVEQRLEVPVDRGRDL